MKKHRKHAALIHYRESTTQEAIAGYYCHPVFAAQGLIPKLATRRFNNQPTSGDIPEPNPGLNVRVKSPVGHIRQRKRCRAHNPQFPYLVRESQEIALNCRQAVLTLGKT